MTAKAAGRRFVAALGVMALLGAACGQEESDLPDPPSNDRPELSQPVAPELTDEEQAAVDEVTALVDEFLALYQEILIEGEPAVNSGMDRLPPLLGLLVTGTWDEVDHIAQNGWRGDGGVSHELLEVSNVDLEAIDTIGDDELVIPVVNLEYCLDASEWNIVDSATGDAASLIEEPMVFKPGARYGVDTELRYYDPSPTGPRDNPQWWLAAWEHGEETTC